MADRAFIVASQHDDLDAKGLERIDRELRSRLYRVGDRHQAGRLTVHRDIHWRLAFVSETLPVGFQCFRWLFPGRASSLTFPSSTSFPSMRPVTPWPGMAAKFSASASLMPAPPLP